MKRFLAGVVCGLFLCGSAVVYAEQAETKKDEYPLTTCIVSGQELGSMGDVIEYEHEGTLVKFCCVGCVDMFKADPGKYLELLEIAKAAQDVEEVAQEEEVVEDDNAGHDHAGHNH